MTVSRSQPKSRLLATLALIAELGWIVLSIPLAAVIVGLVCWMMFNDEVVR